MAVVRPGEEFVSEADLESALSLGNNFASDVPLGQSLQPLRNRFQCNLFRNGWSDLPDLYQRHQLCRHSSQIFLPPPKGQRGQNSSQTDIVNRDGIRKIGYDGEIRDAGNTGESAFRAQQA
jgi:hypothetical protein